MPKRRKIKTNEYYLLLRLYCCHLLWDGWVVGWVVGRIVSCPPPVNDIKFNCDLSQPTATAAFKRSDSAADNRVIDNVI